mgnify:CR=1 FL=1
MTAAIVLGALLAAMIVAVVVALILYHNERGNRALAEQRLAAMHAERGDWRDAARKAVAAVEIERAASDDRDERRRKTAVAAAGVEQKIADGDTAAALTAALEAAEGKP